MLKPIKTILRYCWINVAFGLFHVFINGSSNFVFFFPIVLNYRQ